MRSRTLNRVGVFSAAKLMGLIYGFFGLLMGGIFTLVSLLGLTLGSKGMDGTDVAFGGAIVGVFSIVLIPIFYGVLGFVGGAIMAALYNVVAGWIGGLELELSD